MIRVRQAEVTAEVDDLLSKIKAENGMTTRAETLEVLSQIALAAADLRRAL